MATNKPDGYSYTYQTALQGRSGMGSIRIVFNMRSTKHAVTLLRDCYVLPWGDNHNFTTRKWNPRKFDASKG